VELQEVNVNFFSFENSIYVFVVLCFVAFTVSELRRGVCVCQDGQFSKQYHGQTVADLWRMYIVRNHFQVVTISVNFYLHFITDHCHYSLVISQLLC
jgi:hypothetical protein